MPLIYKSWQSVIDNRTTIICLHAAGQQRLLDEPFDILGVGQLDHPPAHFHCRALLVPWMPGFINDTRVKANEELQRRPLKQRRIGPDGEIGARIPPMPREVEPRIDPRLRTAQSAAHGAQHERDDPTYPGNLSAKDAEAWMRNRWGTDADGNPRTILLAELGKPAANDVAATMDKLFRNYPFTGGRVRMFGGSAGITKAANQGGRWYRRINPRAYADAAPTARFIRVATAKAKRYGQILSSLAEDMKSGFHPPGATSLRFVVAHEFGHHLKWAAEAKVGAAVVRERIDELLYRHARGSTSGANQGRYEAMRSVSRYAAKNHDELIGEALGEVTESPTPRQLARDLIDLLVSMAEQVGA